MSRSGDGIAPADRLVFRLTRGRRRRFASVLFLMVADAALNSIGIGMVLPVLQVVLQQGELPEFLGTWFPVLAELTYDQRITALAVATIVLFGVRAGTHYAYIRANRDFAEAMRVFWIAGIGRNYLLGRFRHLLRRKQGELLNNWQMETASAARFMLTYLNFLSATLQVAALLVLGLLVDWQVMSGTLLVGALLLFGVRRLAFGTARDLPQAQAGPKPGIWNTGGAMFEGTVNVRDLEGASG